MLRARSLRGSKLCITRRAERRWTISSLWVLLAAWASHTVLAYSSIGLISVVGVTYLFSFLIASADISM